MVRFSPPRRSHGDVWRVRATVVTAVSVAVVVALALSGCTGGAAGRLFREPGAASVGRVGAHSSQADQSDEGITIASLRPVRTRYSARYSDQRVAWTTCHHRLKCAKVVVPINWQHVTSASIEIAMVMHPATGKSLGDLLVNPGGPGGSGVEFVEDGVDGVVDSTVERNYDVIGFDPRGVGASAPVTCYDDAGTDAYNYKIEPGAIGSAIWIAAEEKKSRELAAACLKNTGPVLDHIDSVSAAEDMDVIRSALGISKLNFLGYSYGTYLGTLYAGLFPARVGRFVLDGADDPWGSDYEPPDSSSDSSDSSYFSVAPDEDSTVAQAVGFEDSLKSYLRSCIANIPDTVGILRCPFGSTLAGATTKIDKLLASVNKHPLTARDDRKLGGATLVTAIDDSLYDPDDWPDLTRMFVQLEDHNPSQAFDFADDYNDRRPDGSYEDNGGFANLAIGCVEDGSSIDLKYDKREAAELRKVAPILGIYSAYGDLVCSGWNDQPAPFPNTVHAMGTGPIIVVGTTGDPATPYADAKILAKQLDNGHLVTFHGEGHTAYDRGDGCIDQTIDAYLVDGAVPAQDPQCH